MKAAMRVACPYFNTARMVGEYAECMYLPAGERYARLAESGMARAKALAKWKEGLYQHWTRARVVSAKADTRTEIVVGHDLRVEALVHLGALEPTDVTVQLYHGPLNTRGEIAPGEATVMDCVEAKGEGDYVFVGAIPSRSSGRYGYTLRLLPHHEDLHNPYEPGLIQWAEL